jgi:hypothetical protein
MERIRTRCASLWILALVLVVAVGVLVAPATALATGTLAGTVWKAAVPGEKLPGIRVFCYQAVGDANVYVSDMLSTTPDGAYSFTLPAGNYRLMAQDSSGVYSTMFLDGSVRGYDPSPASYAVSDGVFNYQHFYMKLGARFEITAEDWDGTPIPGMYVQAFRNRSSSRTNSRRERTARSRGPTSRTGTGSSRRTIRRPLRRRGGT